MAEHDEDLGADPAAAFEALRAEVAAIRASLDRGDDGPTVPDYAPTLGEIAADLAKIEAHPALQLTPEAFAYQVCQASESARQEGGRQLEHAVQRLGGAAAELERVAVSQRTGREQVRQVAIMTAVGAVAGAIMWVSFAGPIARALPAGWTVPERMAAATLRLDRWEAGGQLMRSVDPASWNGLAASSSLWRENAEALKGCGQLAIKTGKVQRCSIIVQPASSRNPSQSDAR